MPTGPLDCINSIAYVDWTVGLYKSLPMSAGPLDCINSIANVDWTVGLYK